MKRIFAIAIVAVTLACSAALGNPFVLIADSGVDYENTDLTKAHIGFQMVDDHLVVVIDDVAFEGSLPAIDFVVEDWVDRVDFWGDKYNADIGDVIEVGWDGVSDDWAYAHYLVGFNVNHIRTPVREALAAYERAFGAMGFDMQVEDTIVNSLKLVTFTRGDATLSGRFYGLTGDVNVSLSSN